VAKKKKDVSGDIEWYLISIDRLKQIGLILVLLILGGAGYLFWSHRAENPRTAAESAIAAAHQSLNDLAASKDFNQHRNDFDRAQRKLDEAGTLLNTQHYTESESAAIESQTIAHLALNGGQSPDTDAQFITVEGEVSFQRASTSDWKHAEQRGGLFNGDWVKTNDNSSAELMFSNGSLYTIGPNALLEIYSQFNPRTSKKSNSIQVTSGPVQVATTDDAATVRTPGTQVIVDSESTTQVGVDPQKQTAVVATKGTASDAPMTVKDGVAVPSGDSVKLESGQKVSATPAGALSPVKKLLNSPALTAPGDNQVLQANTKVEFVWDTVPLSAAYVLQVSRSRIFSTQEINSKRTKTTATARVTDEGTFYWRVASVGADGEVGPFSALRRFRVTGGVTTPGPTSGDNCPQPKLKLKAPYHVGSEFFIFEGDTDPGATVFVNDEEVDVDSSGHFKKLYSVKKVGQNTVVIKAVNACGKQSTEQQTVIYEGE
jgi:hypothetical protein